MKTIDDLIGLRVMEKPILDSIGWYYIHKSVGDFVWELVWDSVVKTVWDSTRDSIGSPVHSLTKKKVK